MARRLRLILLTIGCVSAVFIILICLEGSYVERLGSRDSPALELLVTERRPGSREVQWRGEEQDREPRRPEGEVQWQREEQRRVGTRQAEGERQLQREDRRRVERRRAEDEVQWKEGEQRREERRQAEGERRQIWRRRRREQRNGQEEQRPSPPAMEMQPRGQPTDPPRNDTPFYSTVEPALAGAVARKRLQLRVSVEARELWWTMRGKLKALRKEVDGQGTRNIQQMLHELSVHFHGVFLQVQDLGEVLDGDESKEAASELAGLLQRRLEYLQNPPDCSRARKLVCKLAKPCGFACQMHHLAYCFILAYASERTLVVHDRGWKYSPQGWDLVFHPLTPCNASSVPRPSTGVRLDDPAQVIALPYVESLRPRVLQLPMAVPRDLASHVASFHGYPFIWFIAQFLRYIMRPCPELKAFLDAKTRELKMSHPIVGVHVRRTDKLKTEAAYHHIDEYMQEVEEWYALRAQEGTLERRVFLATDDPSVVEEARQSYPTYQFLTYTEGSSLASKTASRYSLEAVYAVVLDVLLLSQADYIVCTFSSQVCRLAYELMQTYHVDASQHYYSLDDVYYFGGQQGHHVRAVLDHRAEGDDQLSFEKGDLIGIAGNEKDGESVGTLTRRGLKVAGRFPSHKVEEEILVADFPTYPNIT